MLPDVTLAFCGAQDESFWVRLPVETNFLLEALTETFLEINYFEDSKSEDDLLCKWMFDLHLVRHPVGADARLIALLKLLVNHFGIRRGDGYFLPFSLGHARMAELIGTTRSTVTRQISILRKQHDLQIIDPEGSFLLSARLVELSY